MKLLILLKRLRYFSLLLGWFVSSLSAACYFVSLNKIVYCLHDDTSSTSRVGTRWRETIRWKRGTAWRRSTRETTGCRILVFASSLNFSRWRDWRLWTVFSEKCSLGELSNLRLPLQRHVLPVELMTHHRCQGKWMMRERERESADLQSIILHFLWLFDLFDFKSHKTTINHKKSVSASRRDEKVCILFC